MTKTPPEGVARQLAPEEFPQRPLSEADEEWSGDTGNIKRDEDTPIGLPQLAAEADERLHNRVKQTAATAQHIKETVDTTHAGVDTLRMETKRDNVRLETKIGVVSSEVSGMKLEISHVKTKVDAVHADMTGVKAELAANTKITKFVADQLPTVIGALAVDRKLTQEEDHFVRRKTLEVKAHEARAEIDNTKEARAFKRNALLKLIGGAVALLTSGAVIGWIVTNLSC